MQVKASPPPTQVPPLEQGLEAHVLFLAVGGEKVSVKDHPLVRDTTAAVEPSRQQTYTVSAGKLLITLANVKCLKTLVKVFK